MGLWQMLRCLRKIEIIYIEIDCTSHHGRHQDEERGHGFFVSRNSFGICSWQGMGWHSNMFPLFNHQPTQTASLFYTATTATTISNTKPALLKFCCFFYHLEWSFKDIIFKPRNNWNVLMEVALRCYPIAVNSLHK